MQTIDSEDEIKDPNIVKVTLTKDNYALYFSRSVIPYKRTKDINVNYFKHIGVYAFRKESLLLYNKPISSRLEEIEKLEQLRFLEIGKRIKMVHTDYKAIGIDVMQDLIKARKIINAKNS
jgi:3-deoxy-manno-octulosonate cytidylyltransferase (CMP-KDO synthetase)